MHSFSQKEIGLDLYYYSRQPPGGAIVPAAKYLTTKNVYAELRYNYEDVQTLSALAGKRWEGGEKLSFELTPMLGVVWGNSKGGTAYLSAAFEKGNFSFSTEPQYVASFEGKDYNFYYNWTELDYSFGKFYTGLALQHTKEYQIEALLEPGVVAGFDNDTWLIPFYVFKGEEHYYFVTGVTWKWKRKK